MRASYNITTLTYVLLLFIALGCAPARTQPFEVTSSTPAPVNHQPIPLHSAINLARTSLACVTASSVNGSRPLDNVYYGVLNAFDDGVNWCEGINYTYWLSGEYTPPRVEVTFDVPVQLSAVIVESKYPFAVTLYDANCQEQYVPPSLHAKEFGPPIEGVKRVRITISDQVQQKGEEYAKVVYEIRLLGQPLEKIAYTVDRPRLCPKN
jgi:hypothetical protein